MKQVSILDKFVSDMQINPRVTIQNKNDEAIIYLHGSIVSAIPQNPLTKEKMTGEFILLEDIKRAFNQVGHSKPLEIHLHSKGGDIYTAIEVAEFIKDRKNPTTVYIDGFAGEGASLVANSADNVYMYPNSLIFLSRAKIIAYGNTDDLEEQAVEAKRLDRLIKSHYLARFTGNNFELDTLLKEGTFLTAKECKTYGFADDVVNASKDNNTQRNIENLLEKFKKENKKDNLLNKFIK